MPHNTQSLVARLLPIALLLLVFFSALNSLHYSSPTYDEHEYLSRGYLYQQTGDTSLKLRHPILLDALAAAPLRLLPDIVLSADDPSIMAGDFHLFAARFMWEANGERVPQIFFLARLPAIALLLLLISAVFAWARGRFGLPAGLVAMALAAFDPNLLAHGRLITPDVGQTAFIFLATFCWWRYWQKHNLWRLLTAGLLLGLAQTAGYPALVLYPLFFVIGAVILWQQQVERAAVWAYVRDYVVLVAVSAIVIWAIYGFSWGPINAFGLTIPVPAPYYWEEFLDLLTRLSRQDIAYLNGEVYRGGRWEFFVVGLLVKTPLPILILGAIGLLLFFSRRTFLRDVALWLIPLTYYLVALNSSLNIGYRHIIPMLPFLYIWGGSVIERLSKRPQVKLAVSGLLVWLIIANWQIYPFYLTYFNEAAGGPTQGLNYLVISDLDWGQDLPQLKRYMTENGIKQVYLSYFGTVPPEIYGINYRPIPAWPPRGIAGQLPFHPSYPLPGVYAISAANLVGSHFEENPDLYNYFRSKTPQARLGNSIYIYEIPIQPNPQASVVNWVSYGVSLPEVPSEFIVQTVGTNNIAPRWFDGQQALLFPHGRTVFHRDASLPFDPDLAVLRDELLPAAAALEVGANKTHFVVVEDAQALIQAYLGAQPRPTIFADVMQPANCKAGQRPVTEPTFADQATFLGWQSLTQLTAGQLYKGFSFWRIEQEIEAPLSIFVHLLDAEGQIVAQSDGFGVTSAALQPGDIVVQLHTWQTPLELPPNTCWLGIGLYRVDTLQRFPLSELDGERLFVPLHSGR